MNSGKILIVVLAALRFILVIGYLICFLDFYHWQDKENSFETLMIFVTFSTPYS